MKDIRDLLADPTPSQAQNQHSVTMQSYRKKGGQAPHTPLVESSILVEQAPPASAQPQRNQLQQEGGQVFLKPPVLPLLVHGPSHGSIKHGRGETSPQAVRDPMLPQGAISTINSTLMRHTSSTGSMWAKSGNRSPIGTNNDLKQINQPATTHRRENPDLSQIAEQNESSNLKNKKAQEEFLFQYIKQFQDAVASKEQYRREQAVIQQRRSRRNGNSVNATATSQQINSSVFQNQSSHIQPQVFESTNETAKYSPKSKKTQKSKEQQIERHWYGVTLKIDDKSGFKGHKHLIDKYPAIEQSNIHRSYQPKQLIDDSLMQRSSLPHNSQDPLENNPSKVEDSLFRPANESLPANPMLEVEEEGNKTAHTDELNMDSFDNRVGPQENSVELNQSSIGLPRIAPESITILQDEQNYLKNDQPTTNLPQISSPPSHFSPNFKFMTHANGFHRGAPRQLNKYHKRNATGGQPNEQQQANQDDTSPGSGGAPLLTRRKSNFIQVENQLQQQLQILEEQQYQAALSYPVKAATNRQAFISKNLNSLQKGRVNGYSSGLNRFLRQSLHQEKSTERPVFSGGAVMNTSLQDPLLFDESQIQTAQMSLSMKSNFINRKGQNKGYSQQQDDLLQLMNDSLHEPLTRNDLSIEEEQTSFIAKSSNLPVLTQKPQNRSIFKQMAKEPQRVSLPTKNLLKQSLLASEPRVAKARYLAGTTQVSPLRKSHAKQYYQQFIPQTILNYQVSQDPAAVASDGAFSDNEYGPDQEILASAGMVSSGGFIGDQHHQKKPRKSQRVEESHVTTPITNPILLSSDGFDQQKRGIKSQIANKAVIPAQNEQRKPSTGVPKIIGSVGISKTNSEWKNPLTRPNNFKSSHQHPADTTTTALSSSFDHTNPLKSTKRAADPSGADVTASSFFKSAKASQLQPLSVSSNKKLLLSDTLGPSPKPSEKRLLNLQKVEVNNPQAPQKQLNNKQSLFKDDPQPAPQPQVTAQNGVKKQGTGASARQGPVKVGGGQEKDKIGQQRNGFGQIIGGVIGQNQGKRNTSLLNQSSIDSEIQELAKASYTPDTNDKPADLKEKSVLNTTSKSIKFAKADTSQTSFRQSQSPTTIVPRQNGISRAVTNQSPPRTQTNMSISKPQRSITQVPGDDSLPKEGQILDLDVEHLLHPLRSKCGKKKLCSCSQHAVKYTPKPKSPSPERPQKETPKEEPAPPKAPLIQPKPTEKLPPTEDLPNEKASLESIQKKETAAVASMLEKVELQDTPAFKQHFNEKVTEAESLKGTNIGIRRYQEQAKNKGRSMGQIALDLKDEKLRRQLLDKALKNYYMEPEIQYLIKITKNRNLNDHQMGIVYEKAVDTLEVLMIKLGLDEPYQKVVVHYESLKAEHLRLLLIKVLTRCMVIYDSLGKMEVIFKLMRKRAEMEERFRDFEKNWMTGNKFRASNNEQAQQLYQQKLQTLEQDVAQYCYQSCRLWVQISAFTFDHSIMNEFKFKFGGPEYQPLIRKQVEDVRSKFAPLFGWDKIPLLNEEGRLYYDATEGAPTEIVRVGGGFTTSKGPIGAGAGIVRQGSSLSNSSKNRLNSQSAMRQQSLSPMRSSSKLL